MPDHLTHHLVYDSFIVFRVASYQLYLQPERLLGGPSLTLLFSTLAEGPSTFDPVPNGLWSKVVHYIGNMVIHGMQPQSALAIG